MNKNSTYSRFQRDRLALSWLIITMFAFMACSAYAVNDITIDGDLSDWADETGNYTDPHGDTTPARTDITQFGLTIIDNGVGNPESVALMMVTDDYQDTGTATGDSHKMVFFLGAYEIVVTIQNGCDAVNEVTIGGVTSTAYTSLATGVIATPIYAPADTTADCALEIEFPISALPDLDSDMDGELLDENFVSTFVSRQSGGVGNNNDIDDVGGISPTAVTLHEVSAFERQSNIIYFFIVLFALLIVSKYVFLRYLRPSD